MIGIMEQTLDRDVEDTQSSQKRRQILDGASRVFMESGYEGASMSLIAREAGVSKGTLYVYFPGKEELFSAVVSDACQQSAGPAFDNLDREPDLFKAMSLAGRGFLTFLLRPQTQAIYRVVIAESEKFPELGRRFYASGPQVNLERVAGFLRRKIASGELTIEDPDLAAMQFMELCKSGVMQQRQMRVIDGASPARIEHVVDSAVRLFLRGYRGAP
ncbi:MAG: TetR family transcriptional regulator [Rhizobiales bacterium]|nr:TetR family transcriptional regulator [Hyphomicrobiales bacterium]